MRQHVADGNLQRLAWRAPSRISEEFIWCVGTMRNHLGRLRTGVDALFGEMCYTPCRAESR